MYAASSQAEHAWLYDYIVSFLRSPLWTTPIHSFIDQHCIQFDIPTTTTNSTTSPSSSSSHNENKLHYTELHTQFITLVETLLESSLERIGVTNEQFTEVLMHEQASKMQNVVFDTILAVDDFPRFKRVMQKRNKQLEDEAMQLCESQEAALAALQSPTIQTRSFEKQIRKETRTPPQASAPSATSPTQRQLQQQEHAALQHALRLSQAEHQKVVSKQQQMQMLEDKELHDAIRLSLQTASLHQQAQQSHQQPAPAEASTVTPSRSVVAIAPAATAAAPTASVATKSTIEQEQKYQVEPADAEQPSQQHQTPEMQPANNVKYAYKQLPMPTLAASPAADTAAGRQSPRAKVDDRSAEDRDIAATVSALSLSASMPTNSQASQLSPSKHSTRPQLPPLQDPKAALTQSAPHYHQPASPLTQQQQYEAKTYHFPERFTTKPIDLQSTESSALPSAAPTPSTVAADELQRRKQYLLQQKQKLIAMKEAERQAALTTFNKQQQDDVDAASRSTTSPTSSSVTAKQPSSDTVKSVLKSRLERMMGSNKGIAG